MTRLLHRQDLIRFHFSFHRYFLDSKEEGMSYFRVDEYSGVIYTTQPLDREDMPWHNITVLASEVGRYQAAFHRSHFYKSE